MSIVWRCAKDGLEPEFLADVERLLGNSTYSWYVKYAYRSLAEQAKLYEAYRAGGAKAAPPGKSAHNFGLAVDVILDKDGDLPGLQPTWDVNLPGWAWLFGAVEAHPRLDSGVSFGDGGHIQKADWTSQKGWMNR